MNNIWNPSYKEIQEVYKQFSLNWMGTNISNKFALISLVGYLVKIFKEKKPETTFYQVVYWLAKDELSTDDIKRLSVVCEDFAYGCTEFLTFGLKDKEIPDTIRKLIHIQLPF